MTGWTRLGDQRRDGSCHVRQIHRNTAGSDTERGDIVILDDLSAHKSTAAQDLLKAQGIGFPAQIQPRSQSVEMAFSKLKTLIRKAAARTYDDPGKP